MSQQDKLFLALAHSITRIKNIKALPKPSKNTDKASTLAQDSIQYYCHLHWLILKQIFSLEVTIGDQGLATFQLSPDSLV